jgi:hypothetical protein
MMSVFRIKTGIAVGLALAIGLAVVGRGTLGHLAVVEMLTLSGLAILCVASLIERFVPRERISRFAVVKRWAVLGGVIASLQVTSAGFGLAIHYRDRIEAQRFCDAIIRRLEGKRRSEGNYPARLDTTLEGDSPRPYLFGRSGQFVSTPDGYLISFDEADGVTPHVMMYSSYRGRWTRF